MKAYLVFYIIGGTNTLHKAVNAKDSKANIQCNKLMQLEDSMLRYGVYNVETLEKLISTIHNIHNTTSSHERLFAGQHSPSTFKTLYVHFRPTPLLYKFTCIPKNHTG